MDAALDLSKMSRQEKLALLKLLEERQERVEVGTAKNDLIEFAKQVYPGYMVGAHHKFMAKLFKDVVEGREKRIIINIAPRHGKSELTSYLFPAWFLGQRPKAKIIMATHTAGLSEDFGRRVRNLISSAEYGRIFPDSRMSEDSKSAGQWNTAAGGSYYAVGVGGALAGRGADLLVIDDPHSEQDVQTGTRTVFDQAWAWYQTGPRQRLMWGGAIIVVMTRWSLVDLTGMLVSQARKNPKADQWKVIEFPAIMNEHSEDPAKPEKSLWPEAWPLDELRTTRETLDAQYWNSQYQQNPTSEEGALIKREYWQYWEDEDPPTCKFIIQSWDTAHDTKTSADYSACTTWGVFDKEVDEGKDAGKKTTALILLDAFKKRMEFPLLKKTAYDMWKEWQPDAFVIEKKAAGGPLLQELRMMGIPAQEFSPSRGNDKMVRVNAITDLFKSGVVYAPRMRWAQEVVEECAAFPNGEHDDFVDTVTQALLRFRQGHFVTLDSDLKDEPRMFKSIRHAGYY